MNDDFLDFVNGKETVPQDVTLKTHKYLKIVLSPQKTLLKFYLTNLIGAGLTLILCPQFGFGPFGGKVGALRYIMNFGPVWCGIFCAGLFMAAGNLFSILLLKFEEREWVFRHSIKVLLPWVSLIFFVGMLARYYAPGHLHHSTVAYYLSWYFTALVISVLIVRNFYGKINQH